MDRERKICIWYEPCSHPSKIPGVPNPAPRQRHKAAYCWSCPLCLSAGSRGAGGRNTFERFSDRRIDTRHPWQRCLDAIALHVWKYHGGVWRKQDV